MSLKTLFFGAFSTDVQTNAQLELNDSERRLLETRSVLEDYTSREAALIARIHRLRAVIHTKDATSVVIKEEPENDPGEED